MKELLEKYPKATKVICNYYTNIFLDSLKSDSISEEYKKKIDEYVVTQDIVLSILESQPRALFDVFDENKITIEILNKNTFMDAEFYYKLNSLENRNVFKKRKDAEKEVIKEAFKLLEEKL